MGQFMKGQHYGELTSLRDNPQITIEQYGDIKCIRREEVAQKHVNMATQGLARVTNAMLSGQYDMVVQDEINVAIWFGLLSVEEVLVFLGKRPENVEVILTGRNAPRELIEYADLVSDIKEVKHYFNQGIWAREGIEH